MGVWVPEAPVVTNDERVEDSICWNGVKIFDGNPFQANVRLLFPKKIQPCLTQDSNPNPLHYNPSDISTIMGATMWIPAHCDIAGNETANFFAKKGAFVFQRTTRISTFHSLRLFTNMAFKHGFKMEAAEMSKDKN
ncbi:hypothetical protein TNCV_3783321 [Trichonephila clavipes]|nr:hypothetical protein TNCV_3783321 [Trichonephila clavipes]